MTQPPADPNAQAPGPYGPYGTQPPAGGGGTGAYPGRGAHPHQPAQGYPAPPGPAYPGQQYPGQQYPGQQFQQRPSGQFGYDPRAGHGPRPPARSGRAGKVLRIVGAVCLAVGAALVGAFAFQMTSVLPPAEALTSITGRTPVTVEDNVMQVIYATDPDTTCSVLAPGENAPDLALDSSMSFTRDDIAYSAIGRIGGPDQDNGTYTVECDGAGVVVGPPLSMGAITLGVVFAVAGFGLLIVALFLLIAGFVLRASARRSG